jgi:signal transduction histidine kinase
MVLLAVASLAISAAVARQQSVSDARTTAEWLARTVVEPRIDAGLRTGRPARIAELDAAFSASVRGSDVRAVRLWNEDGVIIYANDPRLIGEQFAMPAETTDAPEQAIADPNRPENRYLDPGANWVQVSLPVVGEDGSRYLLQVSKEQDTLQQDARNVWMAFAPLLAGSMVLLAALLGLLAIRMARRISDELRTREELLRSAMDASELERRRIAADLHDGTVQQLAGVSYALAGMAARANASGDDDSAQRLSEAASASRTSVRELRTLLVDIYPPNLETSGLAPAIATLLDGLGPGVEVNSDVSELSDLDPGTRTVLYRVAREAIANVSKHAGASRVAVRLREEDTDVVLSIEDDGRGFDPAIEPTGHLGLRLVRDLVASVGGRLTLDSAPGSGTRLTVRLERP